MPTPASSDSHACASGTSGRSPSSRLDYNRTAPPRKAMQETAPNIPLALHPPRASARPPEDRQTPNSQIIHKMRSMPTLPKPLLAPPVAILQEPRNHPARRDTKCVNLIVALQPPVSSCRNDRKRNGERGVPWPRGGAAPAGRRPVLRHGFHPRPQPTAARRSPHSATDDDPRHGPAQGRARVTGLPAARPARFAALAPCPGLRPRLAQPVTRRRLAAVPAVPAKLALQLFKTLAQGRVLGLQTSELLALRRELLILLCELLPQSLNLFRSAIIMRRRPLRQVGRR